MLYNQPLAGLTIVNTRASHQAQPLTDALTAQGATVLHYPAIRIAPPQETAALDRAVAALLEGAFDWLVLTSSNTVESLAQRLATLGVDRELTGGKMSVAVVGSATEEAAIRLLGVKPSIVPEEFVANSLAAALDIQPGQRLFLPQSEIARPVLADSLAGAGAEVTQVVAYRTLTGQGGDPVPRLFWEGAIDGVTFTSPSTVHNFLKRLKTEGGNSGMLVDVVVACIGPQTAEAARCHNLPTPIQPAQATIPGLAHAMGDYFGSRR